MLKRNTAVAATMATADYFRQVVLVLTSIIPMSLIPASRKVVDEWTLSILKESQSSQTVLLERPEFQGLVEAILGAASNMTLIYQLLCRYPVLTKPGSVFAKRVHETVMAGCQLTEMKSRREAFEAVASLSPLMGDWVSKKKMKRTKVFFDSSLRLSDFKTIMETLLKAPFYARYSLTNRSIAELCRDSTQKSANCKTNEIVHWASQEVSNFCIINKLKTPLGKAQETLGAIEKVLRQLASSLNSNKALDQVQVRGARQFLAFFEVFEKSMYNAWNGQNVTAFFAANKKTCLDWLSRIFVMVVHAAFFLGEHALVVRQCDNAFPRLAKAGSLGDDLVAMAAISMKHLPRGHQSITGLYSWCKDKLGRKFRWMRGLIDLSNQCFEDGIEQLSKQLDFSKTNNSVSLCQRLLYREMYFAMASIHDHGSYAKWMDDYKITNDIKDVKVGHDKDYLRALNSFGNIHGGYQQQPPTNLEDSSNSEMKLGSSVSQELMSISVKRLIRLTSRPDFFLAVSRASVADDLGQVAKLQERLFLDHALTKSQEQNALIAASVAKQLKNLHETAGMACDIEPFLTYKTMTHSTEQLLLVKKWGDFFLRYLKNKPHLHFQVKYSLF